VTDLTSLELHAIRTVSRGVLHAKHDGKPSPAQTAFQNTVRQLTSVIDHHISRRTFHGVAGLAHGLGAAGLGSVGKPAATPADDSDLRDVLAKLRARKEALGKGSAQSTGSLNGPLRHLDERRAAHLEGEVHRILAAKGKNRIAQLVALRKELEKRSSDRAQASASSGPPAPTLSIWTRHRP